MEVWSDLREKLEQQPALRWSLVGVVVFILLRLRLVLFAAGLPVLVYWHFSREKDDSEEAQAPAGLPEVPRGRREVIDEDDEDLFDDDGKPVMPSKKQDEVDPYDMSFWGEKQGENASLASKPLLGGGGLDDDLGTSRMGSDPLLDMGGAADNLDEYKSLGFSLPGLGDDVMDFGLGGGLDDMDFLGSGFGGGGKGKGKGKGKDKGKDGKGKDKGPREPDNKQIFVAGIGDLDENTITEFFEEVGEVDRLKVLRHEDGQSKGVCFVTFRTEEQARDTLRLHARGADLLGRRLSIRPANGGKGEKGERGEKGEGKGGRGKGNFGGRDRDSDDFDRRREAPDRGPPPRGRDGGDGDSDDGERRAPRGGGGGRPPPVQREEERTELDELLEEALEEEAGPLLPEDFDAGAKRFLEELMRRDRAAGTARSVEALDMVFLQTRSKTRESVRKWPAYVFTLLQKFDPAICDELAERNLERKMKERNNRRDGATPSHETVANAFKAAPTKEDIEASGGRQLIDRWGKPVVIY